MNYLKEDTLPYLMSYEIQEMLSLIRYIFREELAESSAMTKEVAAQFPELDTLIKKLCPNFTGQIKGDGKLTDGFMVAGALANRIFEKGYHTVAIHVNMAEVP